MDFLYRILAGCFITLRDNFDSFIRLLFAVVKSHWTKHFYYTFCLAIKTQIRNELANAIKFQQENKNEK